MSRGGNNISEYSITDTGWEHTRIKVVGEQVVIALADGVKERLVHATVAEKATGDCIEHVREGRALLLDRHVVVRVLVTQIFDTVRSIFSHSSVT